MTSKTTTTNSIPKPLVTTNQSVIVATIVISVLTNFYWLLLLPILAGLSGIILQKNFVILFAKRFLKKKPSEYLQEDKADLRFNQVIATSFLTLSLVAWLTGHGILAIVFAVIVFTAASVALSGFCVGCWIRFQFNQWKYRQTLKKS
ncbi:DUF4395 domain-containing protein [Pseudolactococcus insecticola]|uniref:DUF4395 domain-containing protein n=1 Tax=Pseudolactococcus insecticola TaxID=2709158 RepID=A0A6A0B6P3_9LACT|nr:DUF4395 domain-containing protein [Lactococcus insecticola]GFH39984.1 hypothetical protein Hs20B_03820 [Lactococcus insecticola]